MPSLVHSNFKHGVVPQAQRRVLCVDDRRVFRTEGFALHTLHSLCIFQIQLIVLPVLHLGLLLWTIRSMKSV
jgi:hypothetical protein